MRWCPFCGSDDVDVDETGEYELECLECGESFDYDDMDDDE
jgi:transcription elongation factor Elf1